MQKRLLASAMFASFLCGCEVSFTHPVAPLSEAELQRQFIGTWQCLDDEDENVDWYIHIGAASKEEQNNSPGLMRFIMVAQPLDDSPMENAQLDMIGHFSKVNGNLYLNVKIDFEPTAKEKKNTAATPESLPYRILKIQMDGKDRFSVFWSDGADVAPLVRKGTLTGTVDDSKAYSTDVSITSPTEVLGDILQKEDDLFFPKDGVSRYRRIEREKMSAVAVKDEPQNKTDNPGTGVDPLHAALNKRFGRPDAVTGSGRSFLHYDLENGTRLTIIVSGDKVVGAKHEPAGKSPDVP